jgi:hypothetical protein
VTTAQELLGLLKNAKPGPNYTPKAKPAPNLGISKSDNRGSLYAEAMPDWIAVELPELGGDACIVSVFREQRIAIGEMSTREQNLMARIDCERCGTPRLQQLVGRTFAGGETWAVLACTSCPLDLGRKS